MNRRREGERREVEIEEERKKRGGEESGGEVASYRPIHGRDSSGGPHFNQHHGQQHLRA